MDERTRIKYLEQAAENLKPIIELMGELKGKLIKLDDLADILRWDSVGRFQLYTDDLLLEFDSVKNQAEKLENHIEEQKHEKIRYRFYLPDEFQGWEAEAEWKPGRMDFEEPQLLHRFAEFKEVVEGNE